VNPFTSNGVERENQMEKESKSHFQGFGYFSPKDAGEAALTSSYRRAS